MFSFITRICFNIDSFIVFIVTITGNDNEIYAWLEEGISRKPVVDNETDEIMPVDEKEKSVLLGRIRMRLIVQDNRPLLQHLNRL
jgi:hypothetical protein